MRVTDRNTNIVLGRIISFTSHVDPSVWRNGRVDPKLLDPVCRLSGSGYAALGDLVSVQRPQWKDIKGTIGMDAMPRCSGDNASSGSPNPGSSPLSPPRSTDGALGGILGLPFAPAADRQQQGRLTPIGFGLGGFSRSRAEALRRRRLLRQAAF